MPTTRFAAHRRPLLILLLTVALTVGLATAPAAAPPADAVSVTVLNKAVAVAASKKGAPYRYGAAGPTRFDCSGLVQYSFKVAGKRLPRTARQQSAATTRISARQARPGDLGFFGTKGKPHHVGVYAGNGTYGHAPRTGDVVRKARIATSRVYYGRVH
jgi:cell wall-associated NlpC family hydrolase